VAHGVIMINYDKQLCHHTCATGQHTAAMTAVLSYSMAATAVTQQAQTVFASCLTHMRIPTSNYTWKRTK